MANKLKLIHLFSGVGAPEMALKRLGIPLEIVGFSEIDKYAIQSYKAIHGDVPNLGSVTDIERLPKCNLLVYGSPCQDFSVAGKQRGLLDENGNQTRSGLLFEVERLLETAKANNELPEILLQENVKNLVGKKFKPDFDRWLDKLDELGYNNYWQVLNAKNFGIPQNRERVFVVSLRKDIDKRGYTFPKGFPLEKRLKDVLEPMVDGKYYLSDKIVERFKKFDKPKNNVVGTTKPDFRTIGQRDLVFGTDGEMGCLVATDYKQPKQIIDVQIGASRGRNPENPSDRTVEAPTEQRLEINPNGTANTLTTVQKDNYVIEKVLQVGNVTDTTNCSWDNPQRGRVYDSNGISPTLNCMQGGGLEPKIIEENTDKTICLNSKGGRGGVDGLQPSVQDRVYSIEGISTAITCAFRPNVAEPKIIEKDIVRMYNPYNDTEIKDVAPTQTTVSADEKVITNSGEYKYEETREYKILQTLWERIDSKEICEWSIRGLLCLQQESLLRQNLHEKRLFEKSNKESKQEKCSQICTTNERTSFTSDNMRDMWYEWQARCASYRPKLEEQQFREFTSFVQKLPHEDTSQKIYLYYLWKASEGSQLLREALPKIQEVWESLFSEKRKNISRCENIRIRKLTPRETWRLMDFTDEDFDKAQSVGISNSQLYKQAGNSIVVACLYHIFRRLFIDFDKED